jgi:hypothetical protein
MPIAAVTAGQIIDPTTFGNAVADAINPTAWTAVTFAGTWVNHGAPNQVAQYRKINEKVELRGVIKSGAVNSTAFTLPAGFRPPATIRYGSPDAATITVDSAGVVTVFTAATTIIGFLFDFSITA